MSTDEVIQSLKGKIISKPVEKRWFLTQNPDVETSAIIKDEDTEDTYTYTYEKPTKWTPYNSNLHMHGIKVYVKDPVPPRNVQPSFHTAFCILDLVKEQRRMNEKIEKDRQNET